MERCCVLLLSVLLVGGCSSGSEDTRPDAAAPPAADRSSAVADGRLTVEQAKQVYLEAVEEPNAAYARMHEVGTTEPLDLSALRATAAQYADALQPWTQTMRTNRWPAHVQPAAEQLVEAAASVTGSMRTLSTAGDELTAARILSDARFADVSAQVELLRTGLGLPPAA